MSNPRLSLSRKQLDAFLKDPESLRTMEKIIEIVDLLNRGKLSAELDELTFTAFDGSVIKLSDVSGSGALLQLLDESGVAKVLLRSYPDDVSTAPPIAGFRANDGLLALFQRADGVMNPRLQFEVTDAGVDIKETYSSTANRLRLLCGSKVGFQMDSGGVEQIAFGATPVPSADVNTLDDYKEGSFTPTYIPSVGAFGAITYDVQRGRYIKIGKFVFVNIELRTDAFAIGTGSGVVRIDGLPYAPLSGINQVSAVGFSGSFSTTSVSVALYNPGQYVSLYYKSGATAAPILLPVSEMVNAANSNYLMFQGMYIAED